MVFPVLLLCVFFGVQASVAPNLRAQASTAGVGTTDNNDPNNDPDANSPGNSTASQSTASQSTQRQANASTPDTMQSGDAFQDAVTAAAAANATQNGTATPNNAASANSAAQNQNGTPTQTGTNGSTAAPRQNTSTDRLGTVTRTSPTAATDRRAPGDATNRPELIEGSPYPDIESLRDLYRKAVAPVQTLRRFGSELFINGTGNTNLLPSDLPVGPDYVLGPGDKVSLNLTGGRSGVLNLTVDRSGQLPLPEAGPVTVNGLTIAQAQARIQDALGKQYRDEKVDISLGRVRTIRVYVVGDAQRPGAYDVSSLSTPLSVLYAAGGPTSRGSLRILRQLRGNTVVRDIDLYDFLLQGKQQAGVRLESGDTLVVPPVGPQVTVTGLVHRPAIYELHGEQNLGQVLALAGGLLPTTSLDQVQIERVVANASRTMVSLNLPLAPAARQQTLDDFHVQADDVVNFAPIRPYNSQAVFLEGHVYRPGKYTYHEGMTVADLIGSAQDILPEPSDRVELVRLVAPDFRPVTTLLSLPEILAGNERILLQPFDLVHIYGRYAADAPHVTVSGDVLRPQVYPLSKGMTVSSLIRLAGGFTLSAYRLEVGLTSYNVVGDKSVVVSVTTIPITDMQLQQVSGPPMTGDILLKPGDVVNVRQLEGWKDIGGLIQISGEVGHPGSYGVEKGEHLSDAIRRAGGFRSDAYPAAAVLTRVQVREIEEKNREQLIEQLETMPLTPRTNLSSTGADDASLQQSLALQKQQILTSLRNHPAQGRQSIQISLDVNSWQGTPSDLELRAGDVLSIPKEPQFIVVAGEVYNPGAITYVPGKTAGWYLERSGGVKQFGDKGHVYVLRADGSVVSHGSNFHRVGDVRLHPGDSVIAPAKLVGPSEFVRNLLAAGQIAASLAITAAIGLRN